jgi:hypothetical protein
MISDSLKAEIRQVTRNTVEFCGDPMRAVNEILKEDGVPLTKEIEEFVFSVVFEGRD